MISRIKATYYNQIENMVYCTPNDASLGRKVRQYVCGDNTPRIQFRPKPNTYTIRILI